MTDRSCVCTEMRTDEVLSVRAAALAVPERTAVIAADESGARLAISYADLARRVTERTAGLERPAAGRPFFLTADANLEGVITVLALLESKIPAVLFSPKLTDAEKAGLRADADKTAEPLPADTAFVVYTSGTTGRPKPAVLTRRSLAAGALAVAKALYMSVDDVFQLSLSPARVGGLGILLRVLAVRATLALAPRFSGDAFPEILERDGVTLASLVPAMLADVFEKHPDWREPKGLRALLIGGAPMSDSLRVEAARRRIPIVTTYGMTETGSSSGLSRWEDRFSPESKGEMPLEGVTYRLEDGEIVLSGPMLFAGYWGQSPVTEGGRFKTGDAGLLHTDGSVTVLARQSDLIITGGEKVVPSEVERALEAIPGVSEALVLGMPDAKWGEIVTALLVPKAPFDETHPPLTAEALARRLSLTLARWKAPRRLAWVKTLPLTAEGKRSRRPEVLENRRYAVLHYAHSA